MKSFLDKASRYLSETKKAAEEKIVSLERPSIDDGLQSAKFLYSSSIDSISKKYDAFDMADKLVSVSQLYEGYSDKFKSSVDKVTEKFIAITAENPELTEEEKLQKSIDALAGKDRVGLLGEGASVILGVLGGAGAASGIATAAGASTILGSSTLGSALGGVFVATTPVGWVIGSALVLGVAGYGTAKLVRSGSNQDQIRAELIEKLTKRLDALKLDGGEVSKSSEELKQISAVCLAGGVIDEQMMERIIIAVEQGKMPAGLAVDRLKRLAVDSDLIELSTIHD